VIPGRVPGLSRLLAIASGLALGLVALAGWPQPVRAAGAPTTIGMLAGFSKVQLATGLTNPTVIRFAANGDIYLGMQVGTIYIYRNGAVLPNPVVILNTDSNSEKGLLGFALDPNFATNGYLYVSYTTVDEHAQLSRLTVVNGSASLASEVVYAKGNQLQNVHHSANDLHIGPDGKLWWTVGDNDPSITNAQTLTNMYGKIHRFNLDGSIPADNPFLNTPGAVPSIYAWGLRNPFRFTFLPNGSAMVADTGSSFWEEMDTIQKGANYGWDFFEGDCGSCGYANPTYSYGHIPTDGAISAIAAYQGTSFPQSYSHTVFFGDYVRGDVEAVGFDPTYQTEVSQTVVDSGAGSIADLEVGPDGNLYYVSIYQGSFTEIFPTGPFPPSAAIGSSVNAGLAPLSVQFSSSGSSDPYGLPLTDSWNFGDGSAPSSDPNPAHQYTTNGTYTVTLTVSNGSQTSSATTTIDVGHTAPTASITSPASGATFSGGQTISFAGTATDAVDGTLPASAYTWQVDVIANGVVKPFYTNEVPHSFAGPVSGVTSGTFQVPNDQSITPSTVFRITMRVIDSLGIPTVVTQDIHPALASVSAKSNVAGTAYTVDGAWQTGPTTIPGVVGVKHVLMGVPAQTVAGIRYRFKGFADGSAISDPITLPAAGGSYTANYEPVQSCLPGGWLTTDVGNPLMPGTTDYAAASQTFYMDGAGADVWSTKEEFHYVYQQVVGDATIVARVRYQTPSSPWAKAGLMFTQSTAAGTPWVDVMTTPTISPNTPNINGVNCTANGCSAPLPPTTPAVGNGVHMQWSPTYDKAVTSPTALAGFNSPNEWLRLQRQGNLFTSSYSHDGATWTTVATAIINLTDPVTVGIFDTAHNIGQYSSAAFDNVVLDTPAPGGPLPAPWVDTDVGSPALFGSAAYTNGAFTVKGAGADIFGTLDQFNYVYQPTSGNGNGTLIARLTSQSNTSANAKAGIMFKQSTTSGSPYYLIAITPSNGVKIQWGGKSSSSVGPYTPGNAWMKITRVGQVFTAYLSSDGVTWTAVLSKTLTITSNATVGLFVCSHNVNAIGTATFDNLSFTPGP
jgi:glucose/arabinose dehydrogenase/regulation of enolase protein 1 (concanavalin A-like superfamily)